jgi:hypothetical protein
VALVATSTAASLATTSVRTRSFSSFHLRTISMVLSSMALLLHYLAFSFAFSARYLRTSDQSATSCVSDSSSSRGDMFIASHSATVLMATVASGLKISPPPRATRTALRKVFLVPPRAAPDACRPRLQ